MKRPMGRLQRHRFWPDARRQLTALTGIGLIAISVTWAGAEEPRDPFLFGSRADQIGPSVPTLVGILWDPKQPLAIVGEETVAVGYRLGDWQVIQIHPDQLVIQRGEEQITLRPGDAVPQD